MKSIYMYTQFEYYIPCLSNCITEVVSEEAVFNALVSIRIPTNIDSMTFYTSKISLLTWILSPSLRVYTVWLQ